LSPALRQAADHCLAGLAIEAAVVEGGMNSIKGKRAADV
jgi:hypothetical protein